MELTPSVEIDGDPQSHAYFLHRVTGVQLLGDGSIVVGNSATNQILWFDSAGSFSKKTGGPGEGPGELSTIANIFRCAGDTLVVNEGRRVTVFDQHGVFIRTERAAGTLFSAYGAIVGISRDCSAALAVNGEYRPPAQGDQIHQSPQTLYWASFSSANRDTLLVFPGRDLYPWTLRGQLADVRLPFGAAPLWATNGKVTAFGSARDFEVRLIDRQGRLERIIRWSAKRTPVAGVAWDRFRREYDEFVRTNSTSAQDIPPIDHFPVPDVMPAYAALLLDDAGNLWVRQYLHEDLYKQDPEEQQWWVFDQDGIWLGGIRTPSGLKVQGVHGDYVVGVGRDSMGVEHVRFYRVAKGS